MGLQAKSSSQITGKAEDRCDYSSHNAEDDSQSTEDVAQYFADTL